jgi:predicted MFS family arabinose efflux permease
VSDIEQDRLSPWLVVVMAVGTGFIVANLYYAQPLLHLLAGHFHIGISVAGTIVTCSVFGYAVGLLLVVPLGDRFARSTLVPVIYLVVTVGLLVCAIAPNLVIFEIFSFLTAVSSVAGQIMIPYATELCAPQRRGRVIARVMTGLLIGILLARTVSGLIADATSWRVVYLFSAAMMVLFAIIFRIALPREGKRPHIPYVGLVVSVVVLLRDEPVLRRRAWHGGCFFGSFSILWTSLAFHLAAAPFHYSSFIIGLFGLAGVGGVLAANLAGRLADGGHAARTTVLAGTLLIVSYLILMIGANSVVVIVIGIFLLDAATQGMQITNQAVIYSLRPESRSRLNSAYMSTYFIGGAAASALAGVVLQASGWTAVCLLGVVFALGSLIPGIYDYVKEKRSVLVER